MHIVNGHVIEVGDWKFNITGVKSLKLNQDNTTAEVIFNVKSGETLAELIVYKLDLTTMTLKDCTKYDENLIETRQIYANMLVDMIEIPYVINFM